MRLSIAFAVSVLLTPVGVDPVLAQSPKQVKVVLEFQQQGRESLQAVQGSGGVVVQERRGDPRLRGRGGIGVQERTTRTTRSTGIFTLVQDGGTGTMLVAQEVPSPQLSYFHDYALGKGYVVQGVAWQRVGTALTVRPTVLPDSQIRVRLTPQLSYFTPSGGGTIEIVEAATELIVPNGRRVPLGGTTSSLHEIVRQILGYREQQASAETSMALTATIQ